MDVQGNYVLLDNLGRYKVCAHRFDDIPESGGALTRDRAITIRFDELFKSDEGQRCVTIRKRMAFASFFLLKRLEKSKP